MRIRHRASMGAIVALLWSGALLCDEPRRLHDELCAACHGQRGAPLDPLLYPPLYDNPRIAAGGPILVANKMLRGAGNMYPVAHLLTDTEVVTLANHLASANGSPAPALTTAQVTALRPAPDDALRPAE